MCDGLLEDMNPCIRIPTSPRLRGADYRHAHLLLIASNVWIYVEPPDLQGGESITEAEVAENYLLKVDI